MKRWLLIGLTALSWAAFAMFSFLAICSLFGIDTVDWAMQAIMAGCAFGVAATLLRGEFGE